MNTRTCLLIENDALQAKTIKTGLTERFPEIAIITLSDEESALRYFETLTYPPRFVVSDVMLPWFNRDRQAKERVIPTPHDYPESGFRLAGIRLWIKFRKKFIAIPWVYFTVLDGETIDIKNNTDFYTVYIQKDGPIDPLLEKIDALLVLTEEDPRTADEISAKISKNPSMRRQLLKGLRTPISKCIKILP